MRGQFRYRQKKEITWGAQFQVDPFRLRPLTVKMTKLKPLRVVSRKE